MDGWMNECMDVWWRNLWRGNGSKHGENGHRRKRRGASGRRSEPLLSFLWRITEMGESEDLYKAGRVREIVCVR